MTMLLHNSFSQAHLEDLRARLTAQLASRSCELLDRDDARIERLVDVVRAMDDGSLTSGQVLAVFADNRVPGFSFGRWLVDMVDEGVYLDTVYDEAA
ncbi:hypothetical protein FHG66_10985 [Rubellimicrobium rubrum]|uniref:Uncharacterized protein n=1 Tax=Rubellimicrobium rubrum TaxID=2585369 RepID=A0A5C4MUL2_9RHOB|nr:hypothetical protein [Rubellimicrobium rubrum]TNC49623.1 hypothetical protein FHG66_10985 [Rubellimicrobium rubrum]